VSSLSFAESASFRAFFGSQGPERRGVGLSGFVRCGLKFGLGHLKRIPQYIQLMHGLEVTLACEQFLALHNNFFQSKLEVRSIQEGHGID
jgi:hypothetical protein